MNNIPTEKHPWAPYIPDNAQILILGTFPPPKEKWSMDFYYPNRINDFWRIMGLIFHNNKEFFYNNSERRFNLPMIKSLLDRYGIAMHDTARVVRRLKNNASDKFLEIIEPLPLHEILEDMPTCNAIVSTGEKAAQVIASLTGTPVPDTGKYTTVEYADKRTLKIYRLPSTSRAYPLAIEKKADFYRQMFTETGVLK
ncbi:MAG: uracil-DNA glycosylase family protein [Muribaculaceae bacterium]|nr:uracil-DNA glycosylase family protein [Muribaculaceae bacterium]